MSAPKMEEDAADRLVNTGPVAGGGSKFRYSPFVGLVDGCVFIRLPFGILVDKSD